MKHNKTIHIQEYELPITLNKAKEGGFVATCSVWQDCYAQGETIEQAINEITHVATSLIELYQEESLKVPLKLKKKGETKSTGFTLNFPLLISTQ